MVLIGVCLLMDMLRSADMLDMEGVGEVGEPGPWSPDAIDVRLLMDMLRSADMLGMEGAEEAGPSSMDVRLLMDMLRSCANLDMEGGAEAGPCSTSPSPGTAAPCWSAWGTSRPGPWGARTAGGRGA